MSDEVVLAATDRPLPVLLRRIADERVPEGMVGLGSYLGDRLIARCAVPPEAADFLAGGDLFEDPVPLVLAAREEPPGLQCRLYAVVEVNPSELEEEGSAEEPWAASVPRFEEPEEETDPTQGMVFLGQIVRFAKDRRHPESLPLEAADVLRTLVEGRAGEVVDRVLDDLLGDSGEIA